MKKLLSQFIAAVAGLLLAAWLIPGTAVMAHPSSNFFGYPLASPWEFFLMFGIFLAILNDAARMFLRSLSLPMEVVSVSALSIVAGVAFLLALDWMFSELTIGIPYPVLYIALIIWGIDLLITKFILYREY